MRRHDPGKEGIDPRLGVGALPRAIQRALGERVLRVEASARLRGPSTTDEGQYVLHMAPESREVGLLAYRQSVPFEEDPAFWINLEGGKQAVLAVEGDSLVRRDLPDDWIASDYLARFGDEVSVRFVALNPPRTLSTRSRAESAWILADSIFFEDAPSARRIQSRALFGVDARRRTVEVLALTVHRCRDRVEAETLLGLLEHVLDEAPKSA